MSVHDLEQHSEPTQINTTTMESPATIRQPARPFLARDTSMSPSQMSQGLSHYPSGSLRLDSPVLATFRYHIGIHNDPSLCGSAMKLQSQDPDKTTTRSMGDMVSTFTSSLATSNTAVTPGGMLRPATNLGIYQRVIAAEAKYHREYKIFAIVINGALGLQIIFAAALTALGAGNGPHDAVTAFGALNTVLAGLLTFLKGSGLPNRLKYYENEWSKLREYIEQRERDFASDSQLGRLGWEDLAHEITVIESMYENVRKDIEANTPDSYVSMGNAIRSMNANSHNQHHQAGPPPALSRGLSRVSGRMSSADEEAQGMGRQMQGKVLGRIPEVDQHVSKSWVDLEKQTMVHVREVSDDARNQIRETGKQAEYQVNIAQQSIRDGLQRTQSSAESRLQDVQYTTQSRINDAQSSVQSRFDDTQNAVQSRLYNAQGSAQTKLYEAQSSAQSRFNDTQNAAQSRLYQTQDSAQSMLYDAQTSAQSKFQDAQNSAQLKFHESQNTAQSKLQGIENSIQSMCGDMQQSAESRLHDAQQRVGDTHDQATSKMHEVEEKFVGVAEKAAEKILDFTSHRHH